jgi:hypothetical protein
MQVFLILWQVVHISKNFSFEKVTYLFFVLTFMLLLIENTVHLSARFCSCHSLCDRDTNSDYFNLAIVKKVLNFHSLLVKS